MEGIFQSFPAGRFLTVNPAFARMLGYASPEEMIAAITDIARARALSLRLSELAKERNVLTGQIERVW